MKTIGVDVGGTFTDLIYCDMSEGTLAIHKVSTTPDDPSRGVVAGLAALCDKYAIPRETIDVVFHGTTMVRSMRARCVHTKITPTASVTPNRIVAIAPPKSVRRLRAAQVKKPGERRTWRRA